jgi:hypothetical protein
MSTNAGHDTKKNLSPLGLFEGTVPRGRRQCSTFPAGPSRCGRDERLAADARLQTRDHPRAKGLLQTRSDYRDPCGDRRFTQPIAQLAKTDLLILDDGGLEKMTLSQRNDLLEIMEDRHGLKSTLITSQLPIMQWHKAIGDATLADATLDRLLYSSH